MHCALLRFAAFPAMALASSLPLHQSLSLVIVIRRCLTHSHPFETALPDDDVSAEHEQMNDEGGT